MAAMTLKFIAQEEGLVDENRTSDVPFEITLNTSKTGALSLGEQIIALLQNWQPSGVKEDKAMTETLLTGGSGDLQVHVTVERLDTGFARASVLWPNAEPARELIGLCEDWKSLT